MLSGQSAAPAKFQVEPFWPKPLPNDWVTGNVGGTCVDSNDHVFIVSRTADPNNLTNQEKEIAKPAPPVIEFDLEGNVVNSWGDPKVVPSGIHDCYFDHEGNLWIGGNNDAIAQKYSHVPQRGAFARAGRRIGQPDLALRAGSIPMGFTACGRRAKVPRSLGNRFRADRISRGGRHRVGSRDGPSHRGH